MYKFTITVWNKKYEVVAANKEMAVFVLKNNYGIIYDISGGFDGVKQGKKVA